MVYIITGQLTPGDAMTVHIYVYGHGVTALLYSVTVLSRLSYWGAVVRYNTRSTAVVAILKFRKHWGNMSALCIWP
jgi:hypothetical protein